MTTGVAEGQSASPKRHTEKVTPHKTEIIQDNARQKGCDLGRTTPYKINKLPPYRKEIRFAQSL